ncbi:MULTISPECIES: hypothetical protein [unclassified Streptomyces]
MHYLGMAAIHTNGGSTTT